MEHLLNHQWLGDLLGDCVKQAVQLSVTSCVCDMCVERVDRNLSIHAHHAQVVVIQSAWYSSRKTGVDVYEGDWQRERGREELLTHVCCWPCLPGLALPDILIVHRLLLAV